MTVPVGSGDSLLNPPVPVTVGSVPVTLLNEIMKLAPDTLLLMRVGANPLIVKKLRYYADNEFAGLFDAG